MNEPPPSRRPIKARDTAWAAATARWLARTGLRPNQISFLSVVFAALAGTSLALTDHAPQLAGAGLFLASALFIQLRLLCNLFDGMVAVEGGFRTRSGEIYNELPDRFADLSIFVGAGCSLATHPSLPILGWAAGASAILTAYVRALGASAGAAQFFIGPMAKQQRMAVMTAACVLAAAGNVVGRAFPIIQIALIIVVGGCAITIWRRCARIVRDLERR